MPLTLTVIAGQVAVILPDQAGKARDYLVSLGSPLDSGSWVLCLERIDTGSVYRVVCDATGQWQCDCRDWQFRSRAHRGKPAGHPCKHMVLGQELRPVLRALEEQVALGEMKGTAMNDVVSRPLPAAAAEFLPALTVDQAVHRFNLVAQFAREVMRPDSDFGVIPGTGSKPVLLKPGAEKLCSLFGLSVEDPEIVKSVEDWTGKDHGGEPFFYYLVRQRVTRNGHVIASQLGSCNSRESKYRWRKADRLCPHCGQPAIIQGKEEYGGGWVCFKKKGGCGAKFAGNDPAITEQKVGRVANPDIADQVNTILKMAEKRALIAAVLISTNASEFFTQDLEDIPEPHQAPLEVATAPAPSAATPASVPEKPRRPQNGGELLARLQRGEADMVRDGLCQPGDVIGHLEEVVAGEGWDMPPRVQDWNDPSWITWALGEAAAFRKECQEQQQQSKNQGS